jgi:hypothetical protein
MSAIFRRFFMLVAALYGGQMATEWGKKLEKRWASSSRQKYHATIRSSNTRWNEAGLP